METDFSAENSLQLVKKAGLAENQAKTYLALIKNGKLTPSEVAEITRETRTNTYAICEKLDKMGLIEKTKDKQTTYIAKHPAALEALAEKRRKIIQRNEIDVKSGIDALINTFYSTSEMPSTRTLEGIEGIKEVFADTLRTKKDIYLIRTPADITAEGIGKDFLNRHRYQRAKLGINTYAITPDTPEARQNIATDDEQLLFHRTLIDTEDYTAPVEFQIYGDKVALISYGETQMATIINSPTIAEAMRQICQLITKIIAKKST